MDDRVFFGIDRHVPDVIFVGEDEPGMSTVTPLASVLVGLPLVVGLVALAVVGARSVGAVLRADTLHVLALVDVFTGFTVSHQFVAGIAGALILDGRIDAELTALVHFDLLKIKNKNSKFK